VSSRLRALVAPSPGGVNPDPGLRRGERLARREVDQGGAEGAQPFVDHADDSALGDEEGAGVVLVAGEFVSVDAAVPHSGFGLAPRDEVALHAPLAIVADQHAAQGVARSLLFAGRAAWSGGPVGPGSGGGGGDSGLCGLPLARSDDGVDGVVAGQDVVGVGGDLSSLVAGGGVVDAA
jgi:hypothetical protein